MYNMSLSYDVICHCVLTMYVQHMLNIYFKNDDINSFCHFLKYKFDPKSFINCIIILFYLLLHLSVGMDILNYICHAEADLDVPLEFQLEHLMITTHLSSIIGNWSSKLHYARPACRECTCDAHGYNVVLALAMLVSDVAENNKNNFYDSVVYNNKKLPILFNCSFFVCTWFPLIPIPYSLKMCLW